MDSWRRRLLTSFETKTSAEKAPSSPSRSTHGFFYAECRDTESSLHTTYSKSNVKPNLGCRPRITCNIWTNLCSKTISSSSRLFEIQSRTFYCATISNTDFTTNTIPTQILTDLSRTKNSKRIARLYSFLL